MRANRWAVGLQTHSHPVGGAQNLAGPFANDDARSHGVTRGHARHDGPICDAEVLDSIDLKLGIYNGHGVAPHLCGAGLLVIRSSPRRG